MRRPPSGKTPNLTRKGSNEVQDVRDELCPSGKAQIITKKVRHLISRRCFGRTFVRLDSQHRRSRPASTPGLAEDDHAECGSIDSDHPTNFEAHRAASKLYPQHPKHWDPKSLSCLIKTHRHNLSQIWLLVTPNLAIRIPAIWNYAHEIVLLIKSRSYCIVLNFQHLPSMY